MTPPFKPGDEVIYTEEGKPYEGYDVYDDIMVVRTCFLSSYDDFNNLKMWAVNYETSAGFDWAKDLRLLTPLEKAML